MRCPDAQALLAAYVDHLLSATEREQVEAHVSTCEDCRAELASWTDALRGLELAVPEAAPDLWSQFQARVRVDAAPLTCAEAVKLVPGSGEALLTPREAADLEGHLAACAPCLAEETRLDEAVRVLEAAARSTWAPDLWPAFVERLEREQAAQSTWRARLAAARGWLFPEHAAWTRPALVLGGLTVAALLLQSGLPKTHLAGSTPWSAVVIPGAPRPPAPTPVVKPTAKRTPETPALSHGARSADASSVRHPEPRRRWHRRLRNSPVRFASHPHGLTPAASARPLRDHVATRLAVAHPAEAPQEVPGTGWQPGVAPPEMGTVQEAAQAEVVHAVAMLAGLEDTARRPFEMNADER